MIHDRKGPPSLLGIPLVYSQGKTTYFSQPQDRGGWLALHSLKMHRPMTTITSRPARLLLLCTGIALVASCHESTNTERPKEHQIPEQKTKQEVEQDTASLRVQNREDRKFWLSTTGTDHPYIGPTELTCVRIDHADHIRQGTTSSNHLAIRSLPSQCTIKAQALQHIIDSLNACTKSGPVTHAVTVHYGLSNSFHFVPALQIQCMEYDAVSKRYRLLQNKDCYLVRTDGNLGYVMNGLVAWNGSDGEGKRYRDHLWVSKSPASGFRRYDSDTDVLSESFPYEATLAPLIAHNGLLTSGSLEIVQISTPRLRESIGNGSYEETDFKAEIAWLPVGISLADDVDDYRSFRLKAADLGSPCPPSCPSDWFTFKERGSRPRTECNPVE